MLLVLFHILLIQNLKKYNKYIVIICINKSFKLYYQLLIMRMIPAVLIYKIAVSQLCYLHFRCLLSNSLSHVSSAVIRNQESSLDSVG